MEYKVTYYTLPIKKELYINYEFFNFKANRQRLDSEIVKLENTIDENIKVHCYLIDGIETIMSIAESQNYQMINKYPSKNANFVLQKFFSVKNREIEYLEQLKAKLTPTRIYNESNCEGEINTLIKYKKYKEAIDNTYITNTEIDSLNQHLNDNSKGGWRLKNIQPININMNSFSYFGKEIGSTESVAQIQEGFMVFWEKE